nr:MAG TPA: Tape measure domain protein [Caudoviricetes sp.]
MAGGNLGDLWFQLGVKDNTSKELQKIIDKLKTGDDAANALLRALQGFGTKKSGFKEQAEKAKEFADVLNEINRRISKLKKNDKSDEAKDLQLAVKNALSYLDMLQRINIERSKISELRSLNPNVDTSKLREAELMLENINNQLFRLQNKAQGGGGGGVDSAKVLQDYAKVLQMTFRDVKQITDQFKKENPLSAFSGGAAKVEADIARVTEKLARMRDLMAEGSLKGYNTNMLGGSITELDKILARLQAASGNKSILTDAAQMKNLLSDVAVEMTKAAAATQAYGREKGKVIAQEREFAAASKLSAKDNDAELKALSDYAKRYMALQEAKRKAEKQASDERKRQSAAEARRIEADTERMSRLYAKMSLVIGRGERADMRGLELGVNTSALEKALSEATELKRRIEDANISLMGKGGRPSYSSYAEEVNRLSSSLANATQAQRDLNSAQDKANRKAEAQATRDAAKAKRDDAAAERQRQREIEISTRRMERLDDVLVRLRKEYGNSVKLQVDTTQIETKIKDIENQFNYLKSILQRLGSRDSTALGLITNVGDQREVQLANRVADAQREANREAQRGIEIEQKRQQEIAQSAAKARNDLAAAFAGANAEAKKMQSIVGDIKSLFLQGGIVFGAQQFFNSIVQTGGEIVQQHVALRSILGDVQKADELFAQTQQLALQSPFKFGELNRDVKQLAAFGVEANDLYDTTKRLADIASGLGVDFGRLGLAFGQVKARSWLDGKELRQFAYAGLPLLQKITELYNSEGKNGRKNYTQADVKKMISGRQVSFEDVQKVLWKMTDEGGQFYNMQLVLSETLLGRWNKLIDAWDIMLGKFAEGKNVIGGTFSFIINRVTDLVLALDKLSPAMLSFGAIFAARKLGLMASSKLGLGSINKNYTQQMNAQLRTYAIEQQQLVTEGKITQQKALQNVQARAYLLSDTASRANAMSRLALEGKMSVLQMQKAVKEGLVTKELIRQLAVMGQITARQEQIILGGTRFAAVMNMGISKIGGGIKSLFTMLGGWWGLAIGLAVQTFSSYSSDMDRISENAKGFRDSAYNKKKNYEDELANEKPANSADLQQRVNSMKELLRNSGDYTQTIEDQITRAKNLNEQYDILNKGIVAARNNSQQEANDSDVVAGALGASGGWGSGNPFADTMEDAVEDLNEAVIKYQTLLSGLDEDTKSRMDSVANQFLKPEERAMSLDEKIRILAERGGANWDSFVLKSSNGSNDIANSIYKIGIRANKVSDQINEIAKKNIPRIINFLKKSFNLFSVDFSKWCNRNSSRFASMIERMLDACKVNVPQIREYLKSIFYQEAGAKQPKKAGGGNAVKPKTPMQQRVRRNLSKKGKSKAKVESQAVMLDSYLDETSDYNTDNNLQTELQNRYNEYKNRENKFKRGKISKALRDEAWESYNSLNQAAWEGLGYKFYPQDKKSNKVPKGRKRSSGIQTDKALEDLKKRIDLYKKMYSEIKKFKELYGKGALGQLANDGEFKAIFGDKKRFPISDYTNYETSIKELLRTLPATTKDRLYYAANEKAGIQTENRKLLEDQRRDELNVLNKQLDVISEQYETYKKIYELTGNKKGSENIAFGGTVQFDTYKRFLEEQLDVSVKHDNIQSGLNLTTDEVKGMSLENVKDKYGEETRVYDIRKKLEDENNKIKKETIDLMASLIEKNATIAQQIDDENRKYERQLELIKGIEDPQMRERASEGATKTHNENLAKLQFEQFKQESDWVAIFDDLDRVSSATINTMISNIDEFSRTTGLSIEVVKQLRDALDKLRNEQIDRNPLPSIFGGVRRGNAIGEILKGNRKIGASGINISDAQAKKTGLIAGKWYSNADLENSKKGAYNDSSKAITSLSGKMQALSNIMDPVINLFEALGEQNSILGQIAGGASNAFGAAANVSGGLSALGLGAAGPYGAAAAAALSVGSSLIKAFGADYSSYNKAKAEYDNLTSIWDSLISKKTEYMNIHWGTEATEASKEAQEMLKAEIEQTKVIAQKRLNAGASAGSHSIKYRMWKGSYKYNGQNWRDVAGEISSKYGVQFNGMEDMLNMNADTLSKIKKDYTGLWANMDSDFRDYLEKLIQYGEKADDMIEALTEKLTGNKFSDLVSSWGDAMSTMANGYEDLLDGFEGKLKNTILNSMIENTYGDKIKALLKKTQGYAENDDKIKDSSGNVISEYTGAEYADVNKNTEELSKQIEATRDYLKKTYGWSDNSSSSSRNSVKGITEEQGDVFLSYVNGIRLDCSVMRAEQAKYYPEMSEIVKSQLTQLNAIARNTLRNADAAERIESIFVEYNDNFNRVLNGTKSLKMK